MTNDEQNLVTGALDSIAVGEIYEGCHPMGKSKLTQLQDGLATWEPIEHGKNN